MPSYANKWPVHASWLATPLSVLGLQKLIARLTDFISPPAKEFYCKGFCCNRGQRPLLADKPRLLV
jgi:hypothetical protein